MFSRNLGDEAPSVDCAECCALHASYVEGCHTLEQVEIAPAADSRIREAKDWVATSRRSWLAAVRPARMVLALKLISRLCSFSVTPLPAPQRLAEPRRS